MATVAEVTSLEALEASLVEFSQREPGNFTQFPKILHQVWFSPEGAPVPDKWASSPPEWQRLHPDWLYVLWNEKLADEFIKSFYPDFLDTYYGFPHLIQRCDAIRPLFLERYGGLYVDLDIVPLSNIESHIDGDCNSYFVNSANVSSGYTNALMASKPGAPIWKEIIDAMREPLQGWAIGKNLTVMSSTGPIMFTRVIRDHVGTICRLPAKKFSPTAARDIGTTRSLTPDAVVKALAGGSWHSADSKIMDFMVNQKFMVILLILFAIVFTVWLCFRYFHLYNACVVNFKNMKHRSSA